MSEANTDPDEQNIGNSVAKLNWLRASVLGANDGIASVAGIVLGVAAATNSTSAIISAGLAGTVAGAISMAAGEYISVSSARDTERALLKQERYELEHYPEKELQELADIYQAKGLSAKTAQLVAQELTEHDVFAAHAHAELNIDPDNLTNPWHAAMASAASFLSGAIIPLFAIALPPVSIRIPVAFVAVVITLALTGAISAQVGGANKTKAIFRVVTGGVLAMSITYVIGHLFGISGI